MNIYLSTETNFNNNGLGFLTDTISAVVYDELNGNYSLKIEYMVNGHLSEYLERENIIKCPVADGTKQLFRIVNVIKTYEKIEITALHIFYDLLNNFLADVYPQNKNGQNFLQHLLDNTNFETNFTAVSDITDLRTARYVRRNPVEAIMGDIDNSMVRIFGGELKRNNFTINFLSRVGEDKGVKLLYGKNITGINISIDITEMATRVVPQGYNGLLLPELYVDSPLINNYPTPKILKMEFDDVVYDPNMEEAYHNIEDAYQALRDKVNEQYSLGLDKPRINIDVDWVELSKTNEYKQYSYLETVRLGDTIYADILGIIYTARVISTEYDVLLDRTTKFQIGTFVPTIATEITKLEKSVEQINPTSILQAAQDNATQLITTAMGGYVYKTNNELYIMDTDDPATAQKVWRWNINGLGYSSTGINGTYGIAMTMDGSIVADFITTGTLNANVIQGYGSLTTQVQDNTNAIGDRSGRTSTITQDIASIEAQIGDIADITTSAESEEAMIPDTQFQNIAESYPIRIEVHPIEDNISLLYPKKSGEIPQGNTTQNGTPTPTNPVSVENVIGEQEIVVCGKNLFDNEVEAGGWSFTDGEQLTKSTNNNQLRCINKILVEPNKGYVFSLNGTAITQNVRYIFVDINNIVISSTTNTTGKITTPNNCKYLVFHSTALKTTYNLTLPNPMIEQNSQATSYEPYQGKIYYVNLGKNLFDNTLMINWGSSIKYIPISVEKNTNYTLSTNNPGQSSTTANIFISTSNSGVTSSSNGVWLDRPRTINSENNNVLYIAYRGNSGDETTYWYQLEKGSTATSYTLYKTPIELCEIGDYQDFIKKSTGKNLCDGVFRQGNRTDTTTATRLFTTQNYQVESGKSYTISTTLNTTTFKWAVNLGTVPFPSSTAHYYDSGWKTSSSFTFTPNQNGYLGIIIAKSNGTDSLTPNDISSTTWQLEKGNQVSEYEPYGINWYIKKEIGKVVLDGDENWTYQSQFPRFIYSYNDNLMITDSQLYCTHYVKGQTADTNNVISTWAGTSSGQILIHDERFTTKETFNTWLLSNNVSIYGILKTPQYEIITDDELVNQLETIYKLSLYPSNDLYPKIRKIKFINTSTNEEFEYTLPMDLLYYDSTNYDTFVADYETELITITKNIGYDSSGKEIILQTPQIYTYDFDTLGINLTQGNYQVEIPTYSKGYLFVRLMVLNAYTAQYATKVELRSAITQTSQSIMSEVSQEYATKTYASSLSTRISQTVRSIELSATDNGTSSSITIKLKNEDGTELSSEDANITLSGLVKFTDLSGEGSTIINGSNISTGTINASNVTITNLNANSITAGTLNVARIPNLNANKITAGQLSGVSIKIGNYFKVNSEGIAEMTTSAGFLTMGTTTHPYVSALNVAKGAGGISFRSGTTQGNAGSAIASIYLLDSNYLRINPGSRFYIDSHYGLTGQVSCIGQSSSGTYEYYMAFWKGILVGVSRSPFSTSTYPWLT